MPNLRGKTWTESTPAQVTDANWWEDHLISDEDAEFIATVRAGGGSLGHDIVNANGQTMPKEKKLKFINAEVTDDPSAETTIVDAKGEKGDAATITVGTVTTVPYTEGASVINSGTHDAAILDFQIPRGASGGVWGGITGTLSDQSDLNTALTGITSNVSTLSSDLTALSNEAVKTVNAIEPTDGNVKINRTRTFTLSSTSAVTYTSPSGKTYTRRYSATGLTGVTANTIANVLNCSDSTVTSVCCVTSANQLYIYFTVTPSTSATVLVEFTESEAL